MRKKILAVVLSLTIAVAFMPAMASAAVADASAEAVWADNYSTVAYTVSYKDDTVSKTKTINFETKKSFKNTTGTGYGMVKAEVTETMLDETLSALAYEGFTESDITNINNAIKRAGLAKYYYDFTGAEIMVAQNMKLKAVKDRDVFAGAFTNAGNWKGYGLLVYEPADLVAKGQAAKTAVLCYNGTNSDNFVNYSIEWSTLAESGYDADNFAAQEVTVTGAFTTYNPADGTVTKPDLLGEYVVSDSTTLNAKVPTLNDVTTDSFYVDEVSDDTPYLNEKTYDGAEHAIVMKDYEGITVKYQLRNETTKKYEDVSAAVFKDAKAYNFKAIATDAKGVEREVLLPVTVNKATAPTVGFVWNDLLGEYTYKVAPGYDAWDYIEFVAGNNSKAAFKAHEEEFMALVKDVCEIKEEAGKFATDVVTATFDLKELTDEEKAALAVKYAALANFNNVTKSIIGQKTATFIVKEAPIVKQADEIEFTKAPAKKTYHVKKAKKLKKAKKFSVKAEALSGTAPTYKLINANSKIKINKTTGKITLKKGLKKGTYKFKVKAYTFDSDAFFAASETQAITVKIAK